MNRNILLFIWSVLLFGIFSSVWANNIIDTSTVSFTINNQTGKLNLPEKIFWKTSNITQKSIIVAQDGWNYAEWVTPPAWTINTTWATRIQDARGVWEINIIDVPTILDAIRENHLKTTRFQWRKDYNCGFEGWCTVNVGILEKTYKNFSQLSLSDLESHIIVRNTWKLMYGNVKKLKNNGWSIIAYWFPCTLSQDSDYFVSFKQYCLIWFNGKHLIEYVYDFPEEFLSVYTLKDIEGYFEGHLERDKRARLFWEKKFKEKYNHNAKFRRIISSLQKNFVENLEKNTSINNKEIVLDNGFRITQDFSGSLDIWKKKTGSTIQSKEAKKFTIWEIKDNFIYINLTNKNSTGHGLVMKYDHGTWIKIWEWQDSPTIWDSRCDEYIKKYNMPKDFSLLDWCHI